MASSTVLRRLLLSRSAARIPTGPFVNRSFSPLSPISRGLATVSGVGQNQAAGFGGVQQARKGRMALFERISMPGLYSEGFKEIMMDYVHHEMTRTLILCYWRLLLIIVSKDVFVSLVF